MDVVTGATSTVLLKLAALLQDEYKLQKKVKKDIESIQKELIFMRAALFKVAEVPPERLDHQVKAWASNVKELSYDMEDAVDTYEVRVLVGGGVIDLGNTFANSVVDMLDINKCKARHRLASVIEEMMGLTRKLAELRERYKLEELSTSTESVPTALTHTIPVSRNYPLLAWFSKCADISSQIANLSGWEQQSSFNRYDSIKSQQAAMPRLGQMEQQLVMQDKLTTWLTNKSGTGDVCFIVGAQGAGKTTFATKFYRKFCGHFDRHATVTLSQYTDDISAITGRICTQVMQSSSSDDVEEPQMSNAASMKTLKAGVNRILAPCRNMRHGFGSRGSTGENPTQEDLPKLEKHLKDHSYLLLIDDLWYEETWKEILDSLPKTAEATRRIIVTTRFQAVATACAKGVGEIYNIDDVLHGKSKDIFETALSELTSGCKDGDKVLLSDIPPRLWEMCGDLPLAVVMLAGHVACNPNMSAEGWEQVCSKLVPDSRKLLTQDGVSTVLSHCYNDMPAEIKTCCLYLSMYPKDSIISRKHLTRRWIAEGFVTKMQGVSDEDVAEEHFNHLIKRMFIQPVERSINGKVKNCRVYDLVLEFVVAKAREENFVTVVGGCWPMPPPSGRVRRLSLTLSLQGQKVDRPDSGSGQEATKGMNLSHIRSLSVYGSLKGRLLESLVSPIVQVLDLHGCQDLEKRAMKAICGMLLLKYLSLRSTSIKELHKDIGKLKYLETLDVRETGVTQLPDEVCQLQRLSRIFGGDKRKMKALKLANKMKLKNMKSLRVLSGIEITDESCAVADLEHLTNLKKLAIYRLVVTKGTEKLQSSIQSLCRNNLQSLIIIEEGGCSSENDDESCLLASLGTFSSTPKHLTALELCGRLVKVPAWIQRLAALTKLRLPVTVLCMESLKVLRALGELSTLFCLTFYERHKKNPEGQAYQFTNGEINAVLQKQNTPDTIKSKKAKSNEEICVGAGGFENLKLLRFFAPLLPRLSFLDNAMPKLERLELRFRNFNGIYGIENLEALQEVYLRVHDEADEFTTAVVRNIAEANTNDGSGVRIIRDVY